MHEYFNDAVDPTRPKSSASKILGRKQSDLGRTVKESSSTTQMTSKSSWFRKSLIGRGDVPDHAAIQIASKDTNAPRPSPVPVDMFQTTHNLEQHALDTGVVEILVIPGLHQLIQVTFHVFHANMQLFAARIQEDVERWDKMRVVWNGPQKNNLP